MKKKINYPGTRKEAGKSKCPVCLEEFPARGVKTHLRLKHNLKLTEVTQVKKDVTKVIDTTTQVTTKVIETVKTVSPYIVTCNVCNKTDHFLTMGWSYHGSFAGEHHKKHLCPACGERWHHEPAFRKKLGSKQ